MACPCGLRGAGGFSLDVRKGPSSYVCRMLRDGARAQGKARWLSRVGLPLFAVVAVGPCVSASDLSSVRCERYSIIVFGAWRGSDDLSSRVPRSGVT